MNAQWNPELSELRAVEWDVAANDCVLHWHSAFGCITIEVKQGKVYVNGDLVELADKGAVPGHPAKSP